MQTIIMTVGTSLLKNPDQDLSSKRPWVGQSHIGDRQQAINWMGEQKPEIISAETNTLWRLIDLDMQDEIILLHSETPDGQECAEVLQMFFAEKFGQTNITLRSLPGINYDYDQSQSALESMANILQELINNAQGDVTLAATGGFKAQTMIMAMIGNMLGVPVCYIHEEFKGLIYLPYLSQSGQTEQRVKPANLPKSGNPRNEVIKVRSEQQEPNRPRIWFKVKKMLTDIPWIEKVYYDERAKGTPDNGVKKSPQKTDDGRDVLWMKLVEKDKYMLIAIETTGYTPEHLQQAVSELRERLGRLV